MIQRLLFTWLSLLSFHWMAAQNPARLNVDFVGNLPYPNELSDVWGYVDSAGHEYAIVGLTNGVSIASVSDSAPPVELHFIPGANTIWRDMKTYRDHAYVSNEGGNGLLVIDLSGLPATIAHKDTVINNIQTIHNLYVEEKQGKLYIVGTNTSGGGMSIVDVATDPWHPNIVGIYGGTYVHDVYVRDNIAYAAEINDGLLDIVDVSNPANAISLGSTTYPGAFTHNTWLNDSGNVCFTTDELSAAYIHAFDVSDPTDIRLLDRIRSPLSGGTTIPHNVHVLNDFLIISYYRDGIYIVDASHPEALVEVGYYDTSPLTGSGFNGSWGAYPFLPSGLILASDMEEGLFVLEPDYQRAAFLEGMVLDSITGAMVSGADIQLVGTSEEDVSSLTGEYFMGIADGGQYDVEVSKYGYESKTISVSLVNGQVVSENILLKPTGRVSAQLIVKDAKTLQPIEGATIEGIPLSQPDILVSFNTDVDGQYADPLFVANVYEFVVGKWGYRSIDTLIAVQGPNNSHTIYLEQGYYDDFALDFEWQVTSTASTGTWERGEPLGTFTQGMAIAPEMDIFGDIRDQAYVTGNTGVDFFSDDIDNGTTELISPAMDLTTYNDPLLNFHWWLVNFSTQQGGTPGDDVLRVELSNGLGSITLFEYDDPFSNTWTFVDSVRILDFMPLSSQVFVKFVVGDENNPNIVEAAIDGFEIIEGDPTIEPPTALEDELGPHSLVLESNPVREQLSLRYDLPEAWRGDLVFSLTNIQGAVLQQKSLSVGSGRFQLDFPYASGVYLGTLSHQGRVVAVRKIVK